MTFISLEFTVFALAGVIIYYAFPKKARWTVLLALSWLFYAAGGIGLLWYLLFTTLTTYVAGLLISRVPQAGKETPKEIKAKLKRKRQIYAAIVLLLNFGLLYFVKYWNFTLDLFGVEAGKYRVDMLLPLGISFYIFQSMGYIIDLVRGKYNAQRNIFKLALFVSFFPQLTQGPIGRYDALSPQLYDGNKLDFDNIKEGFKLILWGLIKKLVIADRAAIVASAVIDNYSNYSGSVILFAVIFYCVQLYCDFSGGIDIARGVARIYGVKMAENFNRPLFSTSLADFWRRWHITLGSWLKDYLFYPITLSKPFIAIGKFTRKHIKGKAGKILPTSLATFIVYFVIGIWHGASFKYIAFGCWNGVIITLSLLLEPVYHKIKTKLKIKDKAAWYTVLCIIRTNTIVVLGRYITRGENLSSAVDMLKKTFTAFAPEKLFDGTLINLGLTVNDYIVILVGVLVIFVLELSSELGVRLTEKIEEKSTFGTFIMIFAALFFFVLYGVYRGDYIATEFIYKQF